MRVELNHSQYLHNYYGKSKESEEGKEGEEAQIVLPHGPSQKEGPFSLGACAAHDTGGLLRARTYWRAVIGLAECRS